MVPVSAERVKLKRRDGEETGMRGGEASRKLLPSLDYLQPEQLRDPPQQETSCRPGDNAAV